MYLLLAHGFSIKSESPVSHAPLSASEPSLPPRVAGTESRPQNIKIIDVSPVITQKSAPVLTSTMAAAPLQSSVVPSSLEKSPSVVSVSSVPSPTEASIDLAEKKKDVPEKAPLQSEHVSVQEMTQPIQQHVSTVASVNSSIKGEPESAASTVSVEQKKAEDLLQVAQSATPVTHVVDIKPGAAALKDEGHQTLEPTVPPVLNADKKDSKIKAVNEKGAAAGLSVKTAPVDKKASERAAQERKASLQNIIVEKPRTLASLHPSKKKRRDRLQVKKKNLIPFTFDNADLTDIVNLIAAEKNINIILPQGVQAINQKISFTPDGPIPLAQAERYMESFLDLAGYTIRPHGSFYIVSKVDNNIGHEPIALYVNVPPEKLPYGEQRIRAVYYLSNLRVPELPQGNDPITLILNEMLSPKPLSSFVYDQRSNGIIITDKADNISSVMTILLELDTSGSRDTIEVIPLFNTSAKSVAKLLREQILVVSGTDSSRARADIRSESSSYFAPNTRVVADERNNTLIIMGRESAVDRLKEFVREYMDASPESGNSILHVYDLKYLDAEEFAAVLNNIVSSRIEGSQSTREITGPERFFEGVIIRAETYQPAQAAQGVPGGAAPTAEAGTVYRGGNRLIITARYHDWLRIKDLIDQLDKPQRQVIIEVLIVDLSLNITKLIAGQTRNPLGLQLPPGVNFQSAQISSPIIQSVPPVGNPTLAEDLLALISDNPVESIARVVSTTDPGSLIIAFKDPSSTGVFSILQLLDSYGRTKVLSHPFLITLNNKLAQAMSEEKRRVIGDADAGTGGIITRNDIDVTAQLKVSVTPRISAVDRLNLQITVDINEFDSTASGNPSQEGAGNRTTRRVQTNANMSSGQVLVLGGLTRFETNDIETKTPILGDIPLIGPFFKNVTRSTFKNNLIVLIAPTVIDVKLREGQYAYTRDKVITAYDGDGDESMFNNTKDPITRYYFVTGYESENMIDEYLAEASPESFKERTLAQSQSVMRARMCRKEICKKSLVAPKCVELDSEPLKKVVACAKNPLLNTQR
jgi:general secretion pathway protein D